MKESVLTKKILDALNSTRGVLAWKIHGGPYQEAGIPDIVGCASGAFFALEVKLPGAPDATKIQHKQMARVRAAGGTAVVVRSVEEALEAVLAPLLDGLVNGGIPA